MRMEKGLDTGPVYAQRRVALAGQTAGSLHDALAELGGEALLAVLEQLCAGTAEAVPQDESLASYAAKVFKEDGYVDWTRPLAEADARIRGVTPVPGARTLLCCEQLAEPLLLQVGPGQAEAFAGGERAACGSVRRDRAGLSIACADGWYRLRRVRPPAKKEMDAEALCNGLLQKTPLGIIGTARRPEETSGQEGRRI